MASYHDTVAGPSSASDTEYLCYKFEEENVKLHQNYDNQKVREKYHVNCSKMSNRLFLFLFFMVLLPTNDAVTFFYGG